MRVNFFVFLFLVFLIIPFVIISCTRSLTTLINPSRFSPMVSASPASPTTSPMSPTVSPTASQMSPTVSPTASQMSPTTSQLERCTEGCCICGEKPVGHLFVLYDRSYRLCLRHLSEVPKLIDSARKRIPNTFITLTLYDPEVIVAVAKAIK